MSINSTENAVILIGESFDSSKFVLGEIIQDTYQEIIPKITESQKLKLQKNSKILNGYKIYNTTKKITEQWDLTSKIWIPFEDTASTTLLANTSTDSVHIDISDTAAPNIGQALIATSPTTATWQDIAAAGTGDKNYIHNQSVPSNVWTIAHNLGKFPSVTAVDSGGTVFAFLDINYIDTNNLTVSFSATFSGKAYLN